MKTTVLTFAMLTMVCFAADAADPISEVKEAGSRYDAALMAHDVETLKSIWDADGSFIGESGNVQNKKQMVEGMANLKIEKGFSTDKSYRIVGASVIEVGIYFAWGAEDGKPFHWQHRYSNVWVKKQGDWVVTFEQVTNVEPLGTVEERAEMAQDWVQFFVGDWKRESVVKLDEQAKTEATEWTCEKLGSALIAHGPTANGGESADMMAWDGFHECLYEFGKLSSGDSWNIQFNIISADKLHGVATGALEDGRRGNGVCLIRKKDDDAYEAIFELILDDGSVFRQRDINTRKR